MPPNVYYLTITAKHDVHLTNQGQTPLGLSYVAHGGLVLSSWGPMPHIYIGPSGPPGQVALCNKMTLHPRIHAVPVRPGDLHQGDIVRLKDGYSPRMLVVDAWPGTITVMCAYEVRTLVGRRDVTELAIRRDELVLVRRGRKR